MTADYHIEFFGPRPKLTTADGRELAVAEVYASQRAGELPSVVAVLETSRSTVEGQGEIQIQKPGHDVVAFIDRIDATKLETEVMALTPFGGNVFENVKAVLKEWVNAGT